MELMKNNIDRGGGGGRVECEQEANDMGLEHSVRDIEGDEGKSETEAENPGNSPANREKGG